MKQIYALGVGHNTPVFIDLAESCGYEVVGLYHYDSSRNGDTDHGFRIIGSFDDLFQSGDLSGKDFLLTMGNNETRAELTKRILAYGGCVPSLVHPTAVVSRFASLSPIGVYVSAFAHIQADTMVGEGTVILSGVNISHTNSVGKYCFFAGGATIGAYTVIEDFVFVGQGALSISAKVKKIGSRAYIGARALITRDVQPGDVLAGAPAHVIKRLS